jgi:hypothetical protein
MNWKRGLSRLYLVLWVAWAGLGLIYPVQRTQEIREKVDEYRALRRDLASGAAHAPRAPVGAVERAIHEAFPEATPEHRMLELRHDPDVRHQARSTALAWGLWALVTGAAPGMLLWTTRWVVAGLSRPLNHQKAV